MRLSILERGHRPLQKLQFALIRGLCGHVPGPILMMSYRRDFFGRHLAEGLQQAMRQAGEWSVGELELFAAFVSNHNRCHY